MRRTLILIGYQMHSRDAFVVTLVRWGTQYPRDYDELV